MFDIEVFLFFVRVMESEFVLILILVINWGRMKIRGIDIEVLYGILIDMFDRFFIINIELYKKEEIREIVKIRVKEEKIEVSEEVIEYFVEFGEKISLRYVV